DHGACRAQHRQVQQPHDASADNHRGVTATRREALYVMQHTGQRFGQRRLEGVDFAWVPIDLVAVDQRVLRETTWAPGCPGLTRRSVLVVADVAVAAAAGPAFAASAQARNGDLIAGCQGLNDA